MNDANNKLISLNPKFSINVNSKLLMPNSSHPNDLPTNMYLSGYYINSTMGGVSMESSCENGFSTAKDILKKYQSNIKLNLPILHTSDKITNSLIIFNTFDKLLYKLGLPAVTDLIKPSVLLLVLLLLIIVLIFYFKKHLKK